MTEPDRRQRVVTSTPRLSPDEVASRAFATRVRGYAESEVRTFLKRVADQLAEARGREEELLGTIDTLEEQLRAPRPLSEQELLDALGEETARLLRSAREASDDIRRKAEDRAAEALDVANADAERVRGQADSEAAAVTQDADERASEVTGAAAARAEEIDAAARAESEATIEAARMQGREMLDEAKAARERVLTDLVRRRALLQSQIEALRIGRDRLIDAYRTVKMTFLDATEALAQVEARAAAERPARAGEPLDLAAEIAAEIATLDAANSNGDAVVDIAAVEFAEADEAGEEPDSASAALADVDSLFARIRAGADLDAAPPEDAEPTPGTEPAAEATGEGAERVGARPPAARWRETRDTAIDPLLGPLVKRAKRRVQDDQNALLDAVRRHKGRPTAANVLPDVDVLVAAWDNVLKAPIDEAYAGGRTAAGGETADAEAELVREAAETIVTPLRQRVTVAIDSGEEGDTGGLVERIGARYREWKNQSLEPALREVLAFAWSRGVYDATPAGEVLWWVPSEEGRCSDCDDNGLEPTVKGEHFPTGQPFPPAHPGCRCLLAPAPVLAAHTANDK